MVSRRPVVGQKKIKKNKDSFRSRVVVFTIGFCLCFSLIGVRLLFLQVVSAKNLEQLASEQHSIYQILNPTRGEIKINDRYSAEPYSVATSIEKDLVYASPAIIKDAGEVSRELSKIIGMPEEEIMAKISDNTKKYVILKKQITDNEKEQIKNLKLVGISFDSEPIRYYPEKEFMGNVLGYVGYKDKSNEKSGFYGFRTSI